MLDSIVDHQLRLRIALDSLTSTLINAFSAAIGVGRNRGSQPELVSNGGSDMTATHFASDLLQCADSDGRPVVQR